MHTPACQDVRKCRSVARAFLPAQRSRSFFTSRDREGAGKNFQLSRLSEILRFIRMWRLRRPLPDGLPSKRQAGRGSLVGLPMRGSSRMTLSLM